MQTKNLHMRIFFLPLIVLCIVICSFRNHDNKDSFSSKGFIDTTFFSANTTGGWNTHTSYLATQNDSVQFELILFRNVPENNNWNNDSEAGTIRSDFAPSDTRILYYEELPRNWKITIHPDGKCFFKLLSGPAPSGENIVLPIITKYMK